MRPGNRPAAPKMLRKQKVRSFLLPHTVRAPHCGRLRSRRRKRRNKMIRAQSAGQGLGVFLLFCTILLIAGTGMANDGQNQRRDSNRKNEQENRTGKPKADEKANPNVVQVDLSKLDSDLAR